MQTFADPRFRNEIVVADPNPDSIRADDGMDGDVHPYLKFHWFIIPNGLLCIFNRLILKGYGLFDKNYLFVTFNGFDRYCLIIIEIESKDYISSKVLVPQS
jgi:hypothetical protein